MALKKQVIRPNGLALYYHRIAMVKIDTNQQITILVYSYANEDARNYEKACVAGEIDGEPTFPYVDHEYMSFDYDESMNITNAYEWLKTHPKFVGAEDA